MTTQIHLSEDIGIRHIVNNVDGIKHAVVQPRWQLCECGSSAACIGVYMDFFLVYVCLDKAHCNKQWGICLCGSQRKKFVTKAQITRHYKKCHAVKGKKPSSKTLGTNQVNADPGVELSNDSQTTNVSLDLGQLYDDGFLTQGEGSDTAAGENSLDWKQVVNREQLGFASHASYQYFQQCFIAKSEVSGADYLVKRSSFGKSLTANAYARDMILPPGHTEFQMELARLCFGMSTKQRQLLGCVLDGCFKIGAEDGYACAVDLVSERFDSWLCEQKLKEPFSNQFIKRKIAKEYCASLIVKSAYVWSTKVPRSANAIRNQIMGGSFAIVDNLPIPTIMKDIDGHSYVSIIDCIRDLLGHRGISSIDIIPETLIHCLPDKTTCPSNSRRGQQIMLQVRLNSPNTAIAVSYVMLWSDDVEPNRSKNNRGSVWLLTATVATPMARSHCMDNTYPIAIGRKGDDHGPVIRRLEEEMDQLRKGSCAPFYVGKKQQTLKIGFEIFATLQDQPERRGFNSLRLGNGKYSARSGVSANHGELYPHLKACKQCLKTMEERTSQERETLPLPTCEVCLNWDALRCQTNLNLALPPKDYPLLATHDENGFYKNSPACRIVVTKDGERIRPFRVTFTTLCNASDLAHDAYCNHGWNEGNCRAYLRVECFHDNIQNSLLDHAGNCLALKAARAQPDKYADIVAHAQEHPDLYKKMAPPVPWRRTTLPLILTPDVLMHLFGLGIIKTTTGKIMDLMKVQGKYASFKRQNSHLLDSLASLNISWMKIMHYTGDKLGGWVSENYMGFARIMAWFYQNVAEAVKFMDNAPPEGMEPNKYLKKHNEYWLRIRGLKDTGKAIELKERVTEFMAKENPPCPLPELDLPCQILEDVVTALLGVAKCIMSTTTTQETINSTRHAIHIFLSKFDALCAPLAVADSAAVVSCYNFLCLVNVPDAMELFGPLRHLWEGGPRGEGFALFAKPHMAGVMKKDWHYHLMRKLLREKAFNSVLQEERSELTGVSSTDALRQRRECFHKYESAYLFGFQFEHTVLKNRPVVSVLLVERVGGDNEILGVVGSYDSVLKVVIADSPPIKVFGLHYYRFVLPNEMTVPWKDEAHTVTAIGYGLLLPLLKNENGENSDRFALISSNWQDLGPSTPLPMLIDK